MPMAQTSFILTLNIFFTYDLLSV